MIKICIIHFNTPLLTECLIKSINKFTPDSLIYIFDNSDKEPFTYRQDNIVYIDNTKGQMINFDEWLKKYPNSNRSPEATRQHGSAKHAYSVQKCIELIDDNFILLDSDILLRQDISTLIDEQYVYVGQSVIQPKSTIHRVLPYLLFLNVKMMKANNVHFFNEKRMHGIYYTREGDMYDTGANFFYETESLPRREINITDYVEHYKGGSWENIHNKRYGITLTSQDWLNKNRNLWRDNMPKKVIYTCITGNYDSLLPQPFFEDYDYVCFSDAPLESSLWEIRKIPEKLKGLSPVKQQRYVKLHPHEILSEYEYSIYIDANVNILSDPTVLFDENYSVETPAHPTRICIYTEEKACATLKKDKEEIMLPQIERYKKEGFPNNYGLVQSNIIFRKHNEPDCIRLMEAWWAEIEKGSHRDQLSFNYALWKNEDVRFKYLDKKTCHSEYFNWLKKHGAAIKQISSNTSPSTKNYKWIKPTRPASRNGRDDKMLKTFLSSS